MLTPPLLPFSSPLPTCPPFPLLLCSITPVRDASGRLLSFIGVQSDITELVRRRQAEKELQVRWHLQGAGSSHLCKQPCCHGGPVLLAVPGEECRAGI